MVYRKGGPHARRSKEEEGKANTLQSRRDERELEELQAERHSLQAELDALEAAAKNQPANPGKAELKPVANDLIAVQKQVSSCSNLERL